MKKMIIGCLALMLSIGAVMSPSAQAAANDWPEFSLAWSEYPSWSIYGVLHASGLVDGRAGKFGPIEQKRQVDIVLRQAEYDPCIAQYASGEVDAVCMTNTDALNPSLGKKSVFVFPTSTSVGADGWLVPANITDVRQLKGKNSYGLKASVSEYAYVRFLQKAGEDPSQYPFVNRDPALAAMRMQQGDNEPIVVWNPFVLQTLANRKDIHRLFDTTLIPGEILDAVVMSQAALDRPGGDRFVYALMDGFYAVNQRLADPQTRDQTLIALGKKFCSLDLAGMSTCVKETRIYDTPQKALALMMSPSLPDTMNRVIGVWTMQGVLTNIPKVGYGSKTEVPNADLRFDPTYLRNYLAQANKK